MNGRLIATVLIVAAMLVGAGCGDTAVQDTQTGVPTDTPVATSGVESSATTGTSSSAEVAEPAGSSSAKPADTSAIEKELAAIEKELDAISMPGDSDFDAIEGDLP